MERVCRRQRSAGRFELLSDVHDDKGLILNDEAWIARLREGRFIRFSRGAAKRKLPGRAVSLFLH